MTIKVGQTVSGILFDKGIAIAIGDAFSLSHYDESGAMRESIDTGHMKTTTPSVAVRFKDGSTAVYPASEVSEGGYTLIEVVLVMIMIFGLALMGFGIYVAHHFLQKIW